MNDFEIGNKVKVLKTGQAGKVVAQTGNAYFGVQIGKSVKWYLFNKLEKVQ